MLYEATEPTKNIKIASAPPSGLAAAAVLSSRCRHWATASRVRAASSLGEPATWAASRIIATAMPRSFAGAASPSVKMLCGEQQPCCGCMSPGKAAHVQVAQKNILMYVVGGFPKLAVAVCLSWYIQAELSPAQDWGMSIQNHLLCVDATSTQRTGIEIMCRRSFV